jgi:hypothetical protein
MLKFFRKIRQNLIFKGNTVNYLKYAIGEIILVVIGILIALQINNWNESRKLVVEEKQYYKNIKRQLNEDVDFINNNIEFNQYYYDQYDYATQQLLNNDRSHLDSLAIIALNLLEYSDFHQESNIYAALVNSGEIKLINNQDIVEGLQKLEETYIYINRLEASHFDIIKGIYPELSKIIRFHPLKVERVDQFFEFEFQNHFFIMKDIMVEKDQIYHQALERIDHILSMIDKELLTQ